MKCQTVGEVLVDSGITEIDCTCGGRAGLIWLKAPGVANKSKGIYPRWDTQLGMNIESRQHENRELKARGLTAIGADEFRKGAESETGDAPSTFVDKEKMLDAVHKSIAQVKNREVPIEPMEAAPEEALPLLNAQ